MKDLTLLTWLTQLGLSVAVPPTMFILLAVWLRDAFKWGNWVIWIGIALGLYCSIYGFIRSLKALKGLTDKKKEQPPTAFNEHD